VTDPAANVARPAPPSYSPVVLMVNVVELLRGQGLAVSETYEKCHQAVQAAADLLRWLGVEPDMGVTTTPSGDHGPVIIAAAFLMRAAGTEPSAVLAWPRRTT